MSSLPVGDELEEFDRDRSSANLKVVYKGLFELDS